MKNVMTHRRCGRLPILSLGLVLVSMLAASVSLGQGAFALTGIGPVVENWDGRVAGRGGWGMAETDTLLAGFMNPASLVYIDGVTVLINGTAEVRATEAPDAQRETSKVAVPDVRLGIPIKDWGAFGAGFFTRRSTHFKTIREGTWDFDGEEIGWLEIFRREGTQYEVPITFSARLHSTVSVALGVSLVRGGIKETLTDGFGDTGDGGDPLISSIRISEDNFSATSGTISVLTQPTDWLSLGANWRPALDMDVEREVSLTGVSGRVVSDLVYEMPDEYRVGVAAKLAPRWVCGLDYGLRAFSKFKGNADWEAIMLDEWTCSFGIERQRARIRHGGLRNLPLRLGCTINRWGYTVGGEEVVEKIFSLGTGFAERTGCVDVAISYGIVGDQDSNGYKDSYWRLTISIFDVEKWW